MDNMKGDWEFFEERLRQQEQNFSELRCNPYKDNCFKYRERFWTKQRLIEWFINLVALAVCIWALFSLSSCGSQDDFKIDRDIRQGVLCYGECPAESCMVTEVKYGDNAVWSVYRTVDATDIVQRLDSLHAELALIAFKKFIQNKK